MLKIDKIVTSYGNIRVLHGISLEVAKQEMVTLIGANGAGKTTTLKTISGLVEPLTGTIEFEDRRIDHLKPDEIIRLGISHCPEGRRVFPYMTVLENLEMGSYAFKDRSLAKRDIGKAYELFPILKARSKQRAETLSGGEQQMLAIARAMAGKPKLMLLDEPSLGLAPFLVEQVADIIKSINEGGTSVLLVEQNASLALSMANTGYVLESGTIALEGEARELMSNDHVRRAYLGA
jgi:branched-chain amino acid transport system ATP-binding protein